MYPLEVRLQSIVSIFWFPFRSAHSGRAQVSPQILMCQENRKSSKFSPWFSPEFTQIDLALFSWHMFLHWWVFGNPPVLDILQMNRSHLYSQGSQWITKFEWSGRAYFLSTAEINVKNCFPSDFRMTNYQWKHFPIF